MGIYPDDAVVEYRHVQERHPEGEKSKEVELPMSALATIERLLLAKEQIKSAEAAEDACKAELCAILGDAEYGLIQDELVCTWKTSQRESFDSKKFQKEHPALWDKYRKTTPVRTFRVNK